MIARAALFLLGSACTTAACGLETSAELIVDPDAGSAFDANDPVVGVDADVTDSGTPEADATIDASPNDADAAPTASCPSGTTLLHERTACAAALAPPPSLSSALANATPGSIVSLGGMNEGTAPCLPVLVCRPSDAPTLLFSDSPESPVSDGVLYADTTVANGRYRIYVYHTNGSGPQRKFPVVVLNQGAQPAKVTIVRRGLASPSKSYVSVGKSVIVDWFVDRPPVEVTVPAGQRVLLDATQAGLVAKKDELVHAIFDVVTSAPVKISVVSVGAAADAVAVTAGLSLLPRDPNHQRGTFVGADVLLTLAGSQLKGVQRLRLGAGEIDATLEGIDAPTGQPQKLLGNYGMLYRVALALPSPARAALSARGGAWGGVMRIPAGSIALPLASDVLATTTDAIALGAATNETKLMTAGGSNLPVDLFFLTP